MRTRGKYLLAVLVCIMLGIGSRMNTLALPDFVVNHFGDALWAAMIYFGVRALLNRMLSMRALALSLGFCFVIECSQLYQAEWIINLRNTLFGGLILGKGFLYADLLRYLVGAIAAYAVDCLLKETEQL
ncbi:DUF2809 domain-containing protein [Paenibacillus qinlingensis]|uniref:ribosomal maturation YjgA family protein n=1 Tax=Paenibacillus qinlingensis TaxID=1837343 RepID=UPI003B66F3DC